MPLKRMVILTLLALVALASGDVWPQTRDLVSRSVGYPNLIVNRDQIQAMRRKITGKPYQALWKKIVCDADTQGEVGDIPIHTAYLYRNWVIDSFVDLPFDAFLQAQIAGDILAREVVDETTARGMTVATGFIALSRRFGNTKKDDLHFTIEDTIDTLGRGVLGITYVVRDVTTTNSIRS